MTLRRVHSEDQARAAFERIVKTAGGWLRDGNVRVRCDVEEIITPPLRHPPREHRAYAEG